MAAAPRPRRVLLVHGAWHGAWCWERVLAPLRVLGHEPEAIDLPGHGSSTEPLTDLHGDADAVRARLDAIGEPTLLVGHSYGGMVITDAVPTTRWPHWPMLCRRCRPGVECPPYSTSLTSS